MLLPVIDFGLLILIWMTQLIVYPGFTYMQKDDLLQWHRRYTVSISMIVMPLMLSQLGMHLFGLFTSFSVFRFIDVLLILMIWINTFIKMVPIHNKIARGIQVSDNAKKLVIANWFRTVSWTLIFIFDLVTILRKSDAFVLSAV